MAAAFDAVLREHGQSDLELDHRRKGADREDMCALAAAVVRSEPRVIVSYLYAQLRAVAGSTRRIPVVFGGAADPVGFELIASLKRPGGNITGFTLYEWPGVPAGMEAPAGGGGP